MEGEPKGKSYHIIRFKCSFQQQQNHKAYKETGWPIQKGETKTKNRNYLEERADGGITR